MSPIRSSSTAIRLKRGLPPGPPHPATVQTAIIRLWPYSYLEHCHTVCNDRFTLYPLDLPPLVFLADPQDIWAVLTGDDRELHPGAGAALIAPVVGEHSFILREEEEHDSGRRTIAPAFHRRMVAEQAAVMAGEIEEAVASWPLSRPVALYPRIRALALNVILRPIFSDRDAAPAELHARLMRMLNITDSLLLQEPKLRHLPGWRARWRAFTGARAEVDAVIHRLLQERRSAGPAGGDLLDLLMAAENPDGSPMSAQQIRDNLMAVILAGHETTAGEMAWAFQLLAHNPEVQHRLAEELHGGKGEDYLTATIHETLRRRPVFPFAVPRAVVEPVEIGGWTYRPPAHLAACTYLMHHNPELFPDPHRFRPERFLEEKQQPRTWLPWGGGHKHCLGRHFALLEMQTILREVLSTRTVLPASPRIEGPRWRSAILVPRQGGRVILRRR
jgi:cytochrome P450